ncbi:MAG: hypothetical protein C6W55_07405 [Thermobacillus sp.]|uniref:hypothetical protein n=1 Tax=Thermobacillus sp. TaxID=2108467 RepID=UPI000E36FCBE|nr:hypothetical protein [Thermobacillus sp.]REK56567.1 MAG: hypothetical protein C6W55_07405 [Thermobacillus sp.]
MLSRNLLILIGFGWLVLGGFATLVPMLAGGARNYENFFVVASLAIISFAMAYLAPHLRRKDERIRYIRQKGAFYTSVLAFVYCGVLWLLTHLGYVEINAKQSILILLSLISSTLFVSWIILARKH